MLVRLDDTICAHQGKYIIFRIEWSTIVNGLEECKLEEKPEETVTGQHVRLWIQVVAVAWED